MTSEIRVRIAPSPTGFLHVGTARTALFNFLYAKGHGGKFILRIEDTDRERSQAVYTQNIFDSLKALGLQWDEGPDIGGPYTPYAQSERTEIYQAWVDKLLASGHAYHCFLTQAELDAEKAKAQAEKRTYIYSGACRDPQKRDALAAQPAEDGSPRKPSVRFRIPDDRGALSFQDAVRGEVSFDTQLLGDFVIMKSDGSPSYNFAVVVDDMLMKISHVIRGEDHISNTPRQIMLYEAFGVTPPEFAHVGMILAPDRTKLSKRHGAVAVSDYIKEGYLPEAFCNFLTLLGWSPPDGEEIGTLDHFAQQFELGRITHSPAIFEKDKLNFINSKLIRSLPLDVLLTLARPYLHAFDLTQYSTEQLHQMLDAVREPITVLSDLPDAVSYFFGRMVIIDAQLVGDVLTGPEPAQVLQAFKNEWLPAADFSSVESLAEGMKAFTQSMKPLKTKTVMWTIRAAVTGRTHGADLSKAMHLLGKDVVSHRVDSALTLTTASPA
ncbi:glutamate--tRNA ligase [Vampirovibrio sp.]|uniref:glutamate--tRNA ligase n=1 Tax=Vampirovibrio sp. TaxID=2717857 RepID=UPI003592FE51